MREALRSPFLWAFVAGCVLVTSMRPLLRRVPPPPPVIGRVPSFSLVAASGAPFGSDELAGHVYVASFFFTRCASGCAMRGMAELARRFHDDGLDSIRLVSVSTDPEFDTPERLRGEERHYGADGARWILLTGAPEAVRDLARGLGRPLGAETAAADAVPRGRTLFLVDPKGRLRGRYEAGELGFDEVYWRSRRVLEQAEAG